MDFMVTKRADADRRKMEANSKYRVKIRCRSYTNRLFDVSILLTDSTLAEVDNRGDMAQLFVTFKACLEFVSHHPC